MNIPSWQSHGSPDPVSPDPDEHPDEHPDELKAVGALPANLPTNLPTNVVPLRRASTEKVSLAHLLDRHPAGKHPRVAVRGDAAPASLNDAPLRVANWPITLVLTGVAGSLLVVVIDSFRRGALLLAVSVLLAFFLRLVLNETEAGLLCVRSRRTDLFVLGALAVAMMIFAIWVPAPN